MIEESGDFAVLLARMARDCQQLLKRYQREEEKLSPDDILRKMNGALRSIHFSLQSASNYQAAIIDEFQDTDPLQWQIFRRLFISEQYPWKGYLYLVGDPKQSIYSFRQADIYTYLSSCSSIRRCTLFFSGCQLSLAASSCASSQYAYLLLKICLILFPYLKNHFIFPYQPVQAAS